MIILRRFFTIAAALYFLRSVTMVVTSLPVATRTTDCHPKVRGRVSSGKDSRAVNNTRGRLFLFTLEIRHISRSIENGRADFRRSGHVFIRCQNLR